MYDNIMVYTKNELLLLQCEFAYNKSRGQNITSQRSLTLCCVEALTIKQSIPEFVVLIILYCCI